MEPVLNGASVAILTILQDDDVGTSMRDQAVVLEGDIVLHNIPDLSTALAYVFGLPYALNIDYSKQMRYTFEAIQLLQDGQDVCMLLDSFFSHILFFIFGSGLQF